MAAESYPLAAALPRRSLAKRLESPLGRDWTAAWLFFGPTALLLLALIGWPVVQGLYMSFTKTIGTSLTIGPFTGLKNYVDLVESHEFWFSFLLTIKFTVLAEIFKP